MPSHLGHEWGTPKARTTTTCTTINPMPSGLKRYQTSGHDHFATFTCYHQLPCLDNQPACAVFEHALEIIRCSPLITIKP